MSFIQKVLAEYDKTQQRSEQEKLEERINAEVFACKVSQGFYQDPYFEGF